LDISPIRQNTVEQQYDTPRRTPNIAQCHGIPDNETAIPLKRYGVKLILFEWNIPGTTVPFRARICFEVSIWRTGWM